MKQEPVKTLAEIMEDKPARKMNWPAFVEADAVNFFNLHEIEKMTVEDGNGNKAKLTRQKDNGIKVESSSTTIL
ncbi:MAG: hypothetical protein LBR83_03610 [Clostridiales bacterium]|jgi:hypothetical protein|nr:hypothetical protein [Clostridiales bacterium]